MKRIIALTALAFVLVAGMTAVVTIHPQPAFADGGGCTGSNC